MARRARRGDLWASRELALTLLCIAFTLAAAIVTVATLADVGHQAARGRPWLMAQLVVFTAIVLALIYGGLVYQITRAGYFQRLRTLGQTQPPRVDVYEGEAAPMSVLIPSYKEELPVLRQTLLSAALMEYPGRRVCVLLDDPPMGSAEDLAALQAARRMVGDVHAELELEAEAYQQALASFEANAAQGDYDPRHAARTIAQLYERAARWLEGRFNVSVETGSSHVDRFFREQILAAPAAAHRALAQALCDSEALSLADARRHHRRLAALFNVPVSSFERKRYANLSHAPNKAMNLNAYIGLVGGTFIEAREGQDLVLRPCAPEDADLTIPPAAYLLTLDADSLVAPDYALKLVAIMQSDPRVAVAQTPYSAFPGAGGVLERVAGATTDMQYVAHQGTTAFQASYWVGANALLRYAALTEIRQDALERGHLVPLFIQDRTVIEDTGSTVDLIRKGWRLHNHPERLAYSATPPDFGSLTIQRQRWSNGGLIILPDLIRYAWRAPAGGARFLEIFLRLHYLVSPALANTGLLILFLFPFDPALATWSLPFTALPYYLCYGRDLRQNGYRARDLVHIYALNLLLLPVCLAGVVCSIIQICTGRKAAFARTPKVESRTATPAAFLIFQLGLIGYLAMALSGDVVGQVWSHAVFSALNLSLFLWGFATFIGWSNARQDLALAIAARRRGGAPAAAIIAPQLDSTVAPPAEAMVLIEPPAPPAAPAPHRSAPEPANS